MNGDYLTAKVIILKSLKSHKLLVEYKLWGNLDYDARVKALIDMTCPVCRKVRELTGTWQHLYGTEPACRDCCDENNSRLMAFREEFRNA